MTLYHLLLLLLLLLSERQSYLDEVPSSVTNAVVLKICYHKTRTYLRFLCNTTCMDRIENINTCRPHTNTFTLIKGSTRETWQTRLRFISVDLLPLVPSKINQVVHVRIPTLIPSLCQNICGHKLPVSSGWIQKLNKGWVLLSSG